MDFYLGSFWSDPLEVGFDLGMEMVFNFCNRLAGLRWLSLIINWVESCHCHLIFSYHKVPSGLTVNMILAMVGSNVITKDSRGVPQTSVTHLIHYFWIWILAVVFRIQDPLVLPPQNYITHKLPLSHGHVLNSLPTWSGTVCIVACYTFLNPRTNHWFFYGVQIILPHISIN